MARRGPAFRLEGAKDLERGLQDLIEATSSRTAKTTLKRGMIRAGQPVASAASANATHRTGQLAESFVSSDKVANGVGKKEFGETLAAGGTRQEAVAALRGARRAAAGGRGSAVETYIGAGQLPQAHLEEFGRDGVPAHPALRPAWENGKAGVAGGMTRAISDEVAKGARRARRRSKLL